MSFRTDLIPAQCDGYLDMGAGDIPTEWDPSNQGDHVACTEDGHTDDECCVVHRGEAQASRLWTQAGDMATASVSKAFAKVEHRGHVGAHLARRRRGRLQTTTTSRTL